jgi:hypothetical protein
MKQVDRLSREIENGDIITVSDSTTGKLKLAKVGIIYHNEVRYRTYKENLRRFSDFKDENLNLTYTACFTSRDRILILRKAKK